MKKTKCAPGEVWTHNLRIAHTWTAYKYGALTYCATGARNISVNGASVISEIILSWVKDLGLPIYWPGSHTNSIQGCYPTTIQCGGFELLPFDPGPIHLSLDNLETKGYPLVTILTLNLARTSYRHGDSWERTPGLKPSTRSSSQVAELQRLATTSNCQCLVAKTNWS